MDEQFTLHWNDYLCHITDAFGSLRNDEDLVDVTLSCERKAHKMLLSACSSYFRDIFKENPCQHPVIVFRNMKFKDLEAVIHFMYRGEVNVNHDDIQSFLEIAEMLEVRGLAIEQENDNIEEQGQLSSKNTNSIIFKTNVESSASRTKSSVIPTWLKRKTHKSEDSLTASESPLKKLKTEEHQHDSEEEIFEESIEVDVSLGAQEQSKALVKKVFSNMTFQLGSHEKHTDNSLCNTETKNSGNDSKQRLNLSDATDLLDEYRTSARRIESLESKLDSLLTHLCKSQNLDPDLLSVNHTEESLNLIQSLPVGPDDFVELNKKIAKDSTLRKNLSTVLKAYAVEDLRTSVLKMLRKIMTDETAERYSLTGKPSRTSDQSSSTTKICFEKTEIFKLIYVIVTQTHQVNGSYPLVRQSAGDWLSQAKHRRLRKKPTKMQSKENEEDEEDAVRTNLLSILA